jgi:signal transduction histidine kinase
MFLLNDLLNLSKLETGKMHFQMKATDLTQIISFLSRFESCRNCF